MPKTERPSRFRLPTDVRPREYEVRLEPDLEAGRFRGEVDIAVGVERKRQEVLLHAAELKVERATAHADGVETTARVRADADAQTVTLRFPRPLPAGDARLRLRFSGRLNQHLRGLYAASADGRRYAFSQCEAADARRIFPCFDEPAFKARFRLAVTVPDGLRAVSNSPIEAEHDGPDGHVIRFAPTPLLSTYLFALAVGPREASAERRVGDVPIRIWHAPGKGHLAGLSRRRRLAAGVAAPAGLRARPGGRPGTRRARQHAPDLRRGAQRRRGDAELRRDHVREGCRRRAHDRALPRSREVPRRRAPLHAAPSRGQRRRRRLVASPGSRVGPRGRARRPGAARAGRLAAGRLLSGAG